jgi:hypothetical protein
MHYFGSKQELFRRVIDAVPVPKVSGAPGQATEQILAGLASRLASEPVASLTMLRSMLTNAEAASAADDAITRYQAQIAQAIPADDAGLRVAIISAITLAHQAAFAVREGLSRHDALRAITVNPARVLGLEHRVGDLVQGLDGDVTVWSGDPFDIDSRVTATVVEGRRVWSGDGAREAGRPLGGGSAA